MLVQLFGCGFAKRSVNGGFAAAHLFFGQVPADMSPTCLAHAGLNIEDLLNKSVGDLAYTIVDVNGEISDETLAEIRSIDGVLTLRNLGKPVT